MTRILSAGLLAATLAAALAAATPAQAQAQDNAATTTAPASGKAGSFYAQVMGGWFAPDDLDIDAGPVLGSAELESSWVVGAAAGYRLFDEVRLELEYQYRRSDAESLAGLPATGRLTTQSIMGNIVFELPFLPLVVPYIGVGGGYARVNVAEDIVASFLTLEDRDGAIAYQGFAGFSYAVTDTIALFGEGRWFGTADADLILTPGIDSPTRVRAWQAMGGVRFTFGG